MSTATLEEVEVETEEILDIDISTDMSTSDITCRNRFLGRCKDCKKDYNQNHYPNNYTCKNHVPMSVGYFGVVDPFRMMKKV